MEYVRKTVKIGKMKGLPAHILDLKYDRPLCKLTSAPKLTRDKLTYPSELHKGDYIHADWIIMNTESVQGFNIALLIREAHTRRRQ